MGYRGKDAVGRAVGSRRVNMDPVLAGGLQTYREGMTGPGLSLSGGR